MALYQRTSAQLSHVRTTYRDPELIARLTRLVADASAAIYGQRSRPGRALGRFFADTFPAAVWHLRRFVAVAVVVTFLPTIGFAVWLTHDQDALDRSGSPSYRQEYVEDRFEQYYSDQPSVVFFTQVTTNNIRVSFMAFALGLFGVLPGVWVLASNGAALGPGRGVDDRRGRRRALLRADPPPRPARADLDRHRRRGRASPSAGPGSPPATGAGPTRSAQEGRRAAAVVLGLMVTFLMAGTIEGFLTGSGLSAALRVTVGASVWVAFVGYIVIRGRAAAARGLTGSLGEDPAPPTPLTLAS